jgi:hypothetical protein
MKIPATSSLLFTGLLSFLMLPLFGQNIQPSCGTNDSLAASYLAKYSKIKDLTKARVAAEEKLEYRLALDVNYQTYLLYNKDKDRITKEAYRFIQAASDIFEREVNIKLTVSFIYIWDKPEPYPLENDGDYYNNVQNYWLVNRPEERDAVVSLSCRDGWFYGGYRMCSSNFPRPDNSNINVDLLSHELGHTLGSPHTHSCFWPGGPIDRCTNVESANDECQDGYTEGVNGSIMSYCRSILSFHPLCQNLMRDYAEGKLQPEFKLNAFNEIPSAPAALVLRNPDPQAVTTTPSFEWHALSRADNYRFQIAIDQSFTQLVEDTLIKQSHFQSFGQNTGKYFARYRGENLVGAGGWSSPLNFDVVAFTENSEPPLLLNATFDNSGTVAGYFHAFTGISSYEVEVTNVYDNQVYNRSFEVTTAGRQSFSLPLALGTQQFLTIRLRVKQQNTWSKWSAAVFSNPVWNAELWTQNRLTKASANPLIASYLNLVALHQEGLKTDLEIAADPEFKSITFAGSAVSNEMNKWFTTKTLFKPTLEENTSYYVRSRVQWSTKHFSNWNVGQLSTGYLDSRFQYLGVVSENLLSTNYAYSTMPKSKFYNIGSALFVYDIYTGYYTSPDLKTWEPHTAFTTKGKSPNILNFFGAAKNGDVYMMDQTNTLVRKSGSNYETFNSPEVFYMDEQSAMITTENAGIYFKTSNKGVGNFLNGNWQFFDQAQLQSNRCISIAKDQDDQIWAVMEGGSVWSLQNNEWISRGSIQNWQTLAGLAFDQNKNGYAYGDWGVAKFNPEIRNWEVIDIISAYPIRKVVFDKQNQMWLASYWTNGQEFTSHGLLRYKDQQLNVYTDGLDFFKESFDLEIFKDQLLIMTGGGEIHTFDENEIQRFIPKSDYCGGDVVSVTITSNSTFEKSNQTSFSIKNVTNGAIITASGSANNNNVIDVKLPETMLKGSYTLQTITTKPAVQSNVSQAFNVHNATPAEITMSETDKSKIILNTTEAPGLIYQWQLNGTDIVNATGSSVVADQSGEYTVSITNLGGCKTTSIATSVLLNKPTEVTLLQNTPNPITQNGEIAFYLPQSQEISLNLYNVRGQKLLELEKGIVSQGWHFVNVDGNQLAAGIYIYKLTAGGIVKSLKLAR